MRTFIKPETRILREFHGDAAVAFAVKEPH